jgi:membrane-associated phospholipid phosphatase
VPAPSHPDTWLLAHRRVLAAVAAGLALCTLVGVLLAKTTSLLPGIAGLQPWTVLPTLAPVWRHTVEALAWLGSPGTAVATVLALAAVTARSDGLRWAALVPAAAGVVVVSTLAKDAGPQTSLPSGHSAYAVSVFGLGAWLALRRGRPLLAGAALAVALAMSPARVIEGAHWPADVFAGSSLGAAWLLAVLLVGVPWAYGLTLAGSAPRTDPP